MQHFSKITLLSFIGLAVLIVLAACGGSRQATPTSVLIPAQATGASQEATQPQDTTQPSQDATQGAQDTSPSATDEPTATIAIPPTQTPVGKNSVLPAGFAVAVPAPQGLEGNYGITPSLAMSAGDDPMVAYIVQDPNNDGNNAESTVSFTRWDRANGRWTTPVVIDNVNDIYGFSPQLELARDASNNLLGIAYHRADAEVWLALSADNGVTWKKEKVSSPDVSQVDNPSLALVKGNIYIGFVDDNGLEFLSRSGTSGAFKTVTAPSVPNTGGPVNTQPQVRVDSTGRPGVAFLLSPDQDNNTVVGFWRPDETQVYKATDSNNVENDDSYISMAFAGDKPRIAVNLSRGEKSGGRMYIITSDNGKKWNAPVQIPRDGPNSEMDAFLSLAVNGPTTAAIAAPSTGGTQDGSKCGFPKLARTTDLQHWTTCSPDTNASQNLDASYSSLVFDSQGKLYLAFQSTTATDTVGTGLVVWHEP